MHIKIDKTKCNKCNLCIKICPEEVIHTSNEGFPISKTESCIQCGHCVAICPQNALVHKKLTENVNFPNPVSLKSEKMFHFLASKRSTRNFSDKIPSKEILENILTVSAFSPSDNNTQDRKHIVITDSRLLDKIEKAIAQYFRNLFKLLNKPVRLLLSVFAKELIINLEPNVKDLKSLLTKHQSGKSPIFRKAPVVIITYANKGNTLSRDNCLSAQHYLMLYAKTLGIESCIIGYASSAPQILKKYIKIPKNQQIFAVTALGYSKYDFQRIIKRPTPEIFWL